MEPHIFFVMSTCGLHNHINLTNILAFVSGWAVIWPNGSVACQFVIEWIWKGLETETYAERTGFLFPSNGNMPPVFVIRMANISHT